MASLLNDLLFPDQDLTLFYHGQGRGSGILVTTVDQTKVHKLIR